MDKLDINDPYHILFLEETKEQILQMEDGILQLESGKYDKDVLNDIFRMAHSIKGSAATMEIDIMSELSHNIESLLMKLRDGYISFDSHVMDLLLKGIDFLKDMHTKLSKQENIDTEINDLTDGINAFIDEIMRPDIEVGNKSNDIKNDLYTIKICLEDNTELKGVKALIIKSNLNEIGNVEQLIPKDYEDINDEDFGNSIELSFSSSKTADDIYNKLNEITELRDINIACIKDKEYKSSVPDRVEKKEDSKAGKGFDERTTVRVDIKKINKLINLVEEMIVDKEALNKLCKELKRKYKQDTSVKRLLDVFMHMNYISSELQELALSTRMLPLEHIFNQFPRMTRDIAAKCKKNVKLIIEGKDTGIDRGIIEELVDPLTHIIRNSIDHGIEKEAERIARGKNPSGLIKLSASQGENHVIINIEDDGAGIDIATVKNKAVEKGFISFEKAAQISDEDIMQFIFQPGFSTSKEISSISGRGVGLDIVKSNIGKLNGIIDVKTEFGKGVKFTIKLPLTLAIIKAMLVREGKCTFAVPVASIIEVIRLKGCECREKIHSTAKNEVFGWREQTIPMIRLGDYFDINREYNHNKIYIIVVGHGEKRTALMVEKIIGEQEVVIKSIGDFVGKDKILGDIQGISGVSILGDGSFAYIADIAAISRSYRTVDKI